MTIHGHHQHAKHIPPQTSASVGGVFYAATATAISRIPHHSPANLLKEKTDERRK